MKVVLFLIKLPFRILALPVVAVLTILQWFSIFVNSFVMVFCVILSVTIVIISILSCMMGKSTGQDLQHGVLTGFCLFMIPVVAIWLIERIIGLKCILWAFIKS